MEDLTVDGARPAVALVAALPASWTTDADPLVLLALACDSFDGSTSAPGAANLAAWTGLHRSTIYDAVRRLCEPTSERPALLVVDETTKGRRRTRYRLALGYPQPSGEDDGSDDAQPSGEADSSPAPTVGQPSGNRPASPTVRPPQPSANRRARADTPSPSDTPTPPTRARGTVAAEVRAALIADGVGEGEADDLIRYAIDDPDTQSPRRLLRAPSYLAAARAAVGQRHQTRRRDDAARQLADLAASSPEAARVVDDLASSYSASPSQHLHHARQALADGDDLATRRTSPAPDPWTLQGPRLAAGGGRR